MSSTANHRYRRLKNALMNAVSILCAVLVISPLGLILFYLIRQGVAALNWEFFTHVPGPVGQPGSGMGNAIIGTVELLVLASLAGVPIGVLGGVYLSEYGGDRVNDWIRFWADVLNGVPSIVWGMVAYAIAVVPFKTFSAYSGGLALGFIMIPLVLRTTEEVLVLVPRSYREAGLALGLPQWKMISRIVLPTALKGIVTGVLLAMGRVAGETAPLLFTAFGNRYWSHHLSEPIAALPLQIFAYAISPYDDWHRQAWAGALVLIFLVFALSAGVRLLSSERKKS
ncbi:MAG TPA: phosphate ABC transporter permease PstA [Opitutaceae bacterium]|nr:phosphate ABC transporter permease PstA [Opitutaceae bacterium]HUJ42851.1 phosphate ABC transporter permease PstA [Opitutaceae bacterium]